MRPVLALHPSKDPHIVDPPEVIDDWQTVVSHGGADPASEFDSSQYSSRTSRLEKGKEGRESEPDQSAACQTRRAEGESHRHQAGIERREPARGGTEQQRMHSVEGLECLTVPAEPFEQAIERVVGRQA